MAQSGLVLRWGLKASLLGYVGRLPDGKIVLSSGVTYEDGVFLFAGAPDADVNMLGARPEGTSVLRFVGDVSILGHNGLLAINLSQLEVELHEDRAIIWSRTAGERIAIADAGLPAHPIAYPLQLKPRLTVDGAELFLGYYSAGQDLDDVRIGAI